MKTHITSILIPIFLLPFILFSSGNVTMYQLRSGFEDPPISARPRAYWSWVNGNYSFSRLTQELEEAKAKGMGGFDIWDVGILVDENKIVPDGVQFMSDESVQSIAYAIREATRLGLDVGLVLSSSWNAGGSWIPPEHGVMGLFHSELQVKGPKKLRQKLAFPDLNPVTEGRRISILHIDSLSGLPVFYQDEATLALPLTSDSIVAGMDDIIDLTKRLTSSGVLNWEVPEGEWRIIRYVSTGTGQPLMLPGKKSNGLMLDHFSKQAMQENLEYILGKLQGELGDLSKTNLTSLYTDSYEANTAAWTPAMRVEFKRRNGYDLTPYLPVLDGFLIKDKDTTERIRFDFNKTLSDLIIEHHYAFAKQICNKVGLQFNAEAGGPGPPVHNCPFEDIKALGAVDIPRGEFWYDHPKGEKHTEELQIIKGPASAAHLYNQNIVEAEAFTSVWLWQYGPGDIKGIADRALCEGLNRFIYHTFPHIPPQAGKPGWVYNFGTIINTERIWWPKSKPFHDYIARCCFMLHQGNFVGDVLYYYGDQAPNFVKPKHIDPSLGFGYDYDIVNSDIILDRLDVWNGRLILPHGQSYSVLVLPDQVRARPEVLEKIAELVHKGATVIGPRPEKSYRFYNHELRDTKVREIAELLWGQCDGKSIFESTYGRGKIIWGKPIRSVLSDLNIPPDIDSDDQTVAEYIDFIHRRTKDSELYFIRNKKDHEVRIDLTFRVKNRIPERWHPESGERRPLSLFTRTDNGTSVSLNFMPREAYFVVFPTDGSSSNANGSSYATVSQNGAYHFETSSGMKITGRVNDLPKPQLIDGEWELRFPHGWDAPGSTIFPELISWTESDIEGIRYFSGIAAYHKTFEIEPGWLHKNYIIELDLGHVEEVAEVFINGKQAGISWCAPHVIDITAAARQGTNRLVVEVANVWNNQLIGDAKRPAASRRLKSNITRLPNAWMDPFAEAELRKSGLMGPVVLRCSKKIELNE